MVLKKNQIFGKYNRTDGKTEKNIKRTLKKVKKIEK